MSLTTRIGNWIFFFGLWINFHTQHWYKIFESGLVSFIRAVVDFTCEQPTGVKSIMSRSVNTALLAQLADKKVQDLAASFGGIQPELQEAMRTLEAKRRKDINEAAAGEILNLVEMANDQLNMHSATVLRMEKSVTDTKSIMGAIQRATDYGNATSNYLPLAKLVGQPVGSQPNLVTEVPKEWVKPTTPVVSVTGPTGSGAASA
jgi:hypothetical protein